MANDAIPTNAPTTPAVAPKAAARSLINLDPTIKRFVKGLGAAILTTAATYVYGQLTSQPGEFTSVLVKAGLTMGTANALLLAIEKLMEYFFGANL